MRRTVVRLEGGFASHRWTNLIKGKEYIGSSRNLIRRFSGYFSNYFLARESLKTKSLIYAALLNYGYSNFRLDILEYCEPKDLLAKEQYYGCAWFMYSLL